MAPSDTRPIYKHIKDDIIRQIEEKTYGPNQCLPSERDLSLKYETTRMTVRHALNDLEAEGVVYRLQGKGTFVSATKLVQPLMRASGFSQDMLRRGKVPSSRVLFSGVMKADHVIAKDLRIGLGQDYILVKRLRLADETPMAIEATALNMELCGDILKSDLSTGSLYEKLRGQGLRLVTGNQYMEAALAGAEQAELLNIPKGAAVLHIERHVSDELGRPVEATYSTYRGDQYRLFIEFDGIS